MLDKNTALRCHTVLASIAYPCIIVIVLQLGPVPFNPLVELGSGSRGPSARGKDLCLVSLPQVAPHILRNICSLSHNENRESWPIALNSRSWPDIAESCTFSGSGCDRLQPAHCRMLPVKCMWVPYEPRIITYVNEDSQWPR